MVVPSNAPLLQSDAFTRELLQNEKWNASLAYGQGAALRGLHIMDAPSRHWVETLSGLGATGVELVVAYADSFPQQAHPFIPMLQCTHDARAKNNSAFDLVLNENVDACVRAIETEITKMLAGEISPRAFATANTDFQITRALLGVTV